MAPGGAAAEAGEVEDREHEPDDPDGDPDPRDDEEEDDPDDDEREADSDHGCDLPAAEGGKPLITAQITAHLVADVEAFGRRVPVFVHTIDHPDGRLLVDTGMVESHPLVEEEWKPRCYPERIPRDVVSVINTHLHFDHCGGNVLFAGLPVHVQAQELADARADGDYTVREWVDAPGVTYVEHHGEAEVLPGIRLLPTPGHTRGHQSVLVEGVGVVGGDVGYSFREVGEADTEGKRRVLELGLPLWLAHVERPHVPRRNV